MEALMDSFLATRLGAVYRAIPWEELVSAFGIREPNKGPRSIFSPWGKLALMFLKHYAGCSDRKLVEHLNSNLHYQIFCDVVLPVGSPSPITRSSARSDVNWPPSLRWTKCNRYLPRNGGPICRSLAVSAWMPPATKVTSATRRTSNFYGRPWNGTITYSGSSAGYWECPCPGPSSTNGRNATEATADQGGHQGKQSGA